MPRHNVCRFHCLFVNVLQVVMTSLEAVTKPVERTFQEQVRLHKTSNLDPLYNVQAAGKQFCAGYSTRILRKLTDVEFASVSDVVENDVRGTLRNCATGCMEKSGVSRIGDRRAG